MANFERFSAFEGAEHKYFLGERADGRGAFPLDSQVLFEVDAPMNTETAAMILLSDDDGVVRERKMERFEGRFCLTMNTSELSGEDGALYFYKYRFQTTSGAFEMRRRELDLSEEIVDAHDGFENAFQLLIYKKREKYPSFLKGAVMYQIFPDRFCRSGKTKPRADVVVQREDETPIYPVPGKKFQNDNFYLGDLWGVADKLDYIASLGVNIIYLNPIFEAYSNHRYDTGDYMRVDKMLGGERAFRHLIKKARRRGIKIILDGVFNHTGDDSVYFNKRGNYAFVGAYQSKSSLYYRWYNFKKYPDDYECWWDFKSLPRVRCDEPSYRDFICGRHGVVRKYLRRGVSGWRLDVADELSDGFLSELKRAALTENKEAYIVGEVWEDASNKISYGTRKKYFRGTELDGVMNYPCRAAIINYVRYGDFLGILKTFRQIYGNYPPESANCSMNILGTHDTERIITALVGTLPNGKTKAELANIKLSLSERQRGAALVKMAYAMLAALPGIPCVYYGDEVGMEGYDDPLCRGFFPWGKEDKELLSFFSLVGNVRRKEEIFAQGKFCIRFADADVVCLERSYKNKAIAAIINRSDSRYEFISSGARELLFGAQGEKIEIKPMSAGFFKISANENYSVHKFIEREK